MGKILINISGGIDSCSLLKKYLKETDYEIVCHKIYYDIRNSKRQKKEIQSLEVFFEEMRKIRDFEVVLTYTKFLAMPKNTLDVPNLAMLTIPIAQAKKADKIIFGFISDKDNQEERLNGMLKIFNSWYLDMCSLNANSIDWKPISENIFQLSEFHNTKSEYIKYLGEDIKNTWYCRGKKKNFNWQEPCGECHSCKHVKKSMKELECTQKIS